MSRRQWLGVLLVAAAGRLHAAPAASRRLGVLLFDTQAAWAFLQRDLPQALARHGWEVGRNLVIDWRFADGDAARLPELARQLVHAGAQVLMARGTPATEALVNASSTLPIVTGVGDPVGAGFAASLARPGRNVTGLSYAQAETTAKQLQLLHELMPAMTTVLALVDHTRERQLKLLLSPILRAAQAQKLIVMPVILRDAASIGKDLREARGSRPARQVGALVLGSPGTPAELASALLAEHLPAMFPQREYVVQGGLMSWRLDWDDQTERIAVQLDKVLRGMSPATIPFEFPTRSEMALNLGTARQLGLQVSASLRSLATEIIE